MRRRRVMGMGGRTGMATVVSKEEKRWLTELAAQQIAEKKGEGSLTQSRKRSVGGARYRRRHVYGQGELLYFFLLCPH